MPASMRSIEGQNCVQKKIHCLRGLVETHACSPNYYYWIWVGRPMKLGHFKLLLPGFVEHTCKCSPFKSISMWVACNRELWKPLPILP